MECKGRANQARSLFVADYVHGLTFFVSMEFRASTVRADAERVFIVALNFTQGFVVAKIIAMPPSHIRSFTQLFRCASSLRKRGESYAWL
jgi:hypothetical protein